MCVVQGPDAEDALISEATLAVAISNAEHLARLNENMSRLIKILDSIDKSLDAEVGVQMDGGK
jgi:flagellin-specific chaperone FliS